MVRLSLFLPPNLTRVYPPMDHGVLEVWKRKFHQKLLSVVVLTLENEVGVTEKLKSPDIIIGHD